MKTSRGGRSLKKYERSNLLFFLFIIVALGTLVSFVFRHYGTRNMEIAEDSDPGVISESVSAASDVGLFYLGTRLSERTIECRSRLEIPVTDDGLLKELFALPGVEEVTLNQKVIVIRKSSSMGWERIQPGLRRIVKEHLHIHF
ncbi:MAG: hypothetical protein GXX84_09665 [Acidobacteria bacterium]|nr:hypothetical protein [Acidobacteriota bacterium]